MRPSRLLLLAGAVAVAALIVVGLTELGGSPAPAAPSRLTLGQMRARLAGSPPALAALHAQAGELLPGGLAAVRARLSSLRGEPVVVDKWASWCTACRAELGIFQRVSVTMGRQVAFLGIDSEDTERDKALAFLQANPISYPSYFDPSGQIGRAITDSVFTPVTVFLTRSGSTFIRQGEYPSAAKLERDVERYALGT